MKSHSEGIAMLAWSPDDTLLLSCGKEDNQEAMVYSTQVSDYTGVSMITGYSRGETDMFQYFTTILYVQIRNSREHGRGNQPRG